MTILMYLDEILKKYAARNLLHYTQDLTTLKGILQSWAGGCFVEIINSGSRAKGTAISLASDVDYVISLKSSCNDNNGGLKGIFDLLHTRLKKSYSDTRRQNVSIRVNIRGLEIDVTPARKLPGIINLHNLYVSKRDTWTQTNIQRHINDVSKSGRLNEIKLLKIWRELNGLDFPSIYLEYLVINHILYNKSKDASSLVGNFEHMMVELAKDIGNPLNVRIIDPANSNNILSDLLNQVEKNKIISAAKAALGKNWTEVLY